MNPTLINGIKKMNIKTIHKTFNTAIAVGTFAVSAFKLMMKGFKMYEKKFGKK